ncbi:MAG: DUF1553 domain-containing protein, partial [Luteolibacter sp.]
MPADSERWEALIHEITAAEKSLSSQRETARTRFDAWLANCEKNQKKPDPTLSVHLPMIDDSEQIRGWVDGQAREWNAELRYVDSPLGMAPVITGTSIDLGDIGSFSRADSVSYGGFIRIEGRPNGGIIARMDPASGHRGWDLFLENGHPGSHVIHSWNSSALKATAKQALAEGQWHHLVVTYDGSATGKAALRVFVNGVSVETKTAPDSLNGEIETPVSLRIGSREGGGYKLQNGSVAFQDFRLYRRLLAPEEVAALAEAALMDHLAQQAAAKRIEKQNELLYKFYSDHIDPILRAAHEDLAVLKREQATLRARGSVSLVMVEKNEEPFAHVLKRGVYSDKGERVSPNTPAVLPAMNQDWPKNRLGLAYWLTDPRNPLPARVTMNRLWQQFFGVGLVESADDFGVMGARPSHQELLDWLASEFIDSGWNHRHMVKTIVGSAAYRQSARVTAAMLEADPHNRWISRGPRRRLDAEPLRDLALAASGLLSAQVGGPPVKPYQPEGIWEAVAMKQSDTRYYRQDQAESLYRRSIYTFWKRTAPPASMEILNAPSREKFCVRRDLTNTPLQAL